MAAFLVEGQRVEIHHAADVRFGLQDIARFILEQKGEHAILRCFAAKAHICAQWHRGWLRIVGWCFIFIGGDKIQMDHSAWSPLRLNVCA